MAPFNKPSAEIFVPDGIAPEKALLRTTHLGVSAHQDDLEMMAFKAIIDCFGSEQDWFTGVVLSDGAGSPRDELYAAYTDDEMRFVRRKEQKKAAVIGEYGSLLLLDFSSQEVKDPRFQGVVDDLEFVFRAARPRFVFTHNLGDKHDTHVATVLRVVTALRRLPPELRPAALYGCEIWRGLDWMDDSQKVAFDVSARPNLSAALLGVYDSQICGGKRYDLATVGRRRANATFFLSNVVDQAEQISFAMDLTRLIQEDQLDPAAWISEQIQRFAQDVADRVGRLGAVSPTR